MSLTDGLSNPPKLDNLAVDGLLGVNNSLAYKVHEIEKHFHNTERWIGMAAIPSGTVHIGDSDSMTAFQIDAGNDDWGAWVQVLGSGDIPWTPGVVKGDAHRLLITDVERKKKITRIQIAFGPVDAATALAANDYSEIMVTPDNDAKEDPFEIMMPRISIGDMAWARCWVKAENTGTIDFFYGVHGYKG